MAPPEFNPNSYDAQFSKILQMLEQQHTSMEAGFKAMCEKQDKTNGRVTALETALAFMKGKAAGIAFVVGTAVTVIGWFITH